MGEFKGAGEPLTRDEHEPGATGQQYESSSSATSTSNSSSGLLHGSGISHRRSRAGDLIDIWRVHVPDAARDAKLIDAVGYEDEVISTLAKQARARGVAEARPRLCPAEV